MAYLGSSVNLYRRAFKHLSTKDFNQTNVRLSRTIAKYGKDAMVLFVFPIGPRSHITLTQLQAWEEYLINCLPVEYRLNSSLSTCGKPRSHVNSQASIDKGRMTQLENQKTGVKVKITDTLTGTVTVYKSQMEVHRELKINRTTLWRYNKAGKSVCSRYLVEFLSKRHH